MAIPDDAEVQLLDSLKAALEKAQGGQWTEKNTTKVPGARGGKFLKSSGTDIKWTEEKTPVTMTAAVITPDRETDMAVLSITQSTGKEVLHAGKNFLDAVDFTPYSGVRALLQKLADTAKIPLVRDGDYLNPAPNALTLSPNAIAGITGVSFSNKVDTIGKLLRALNDLLAEHVESRPPAALDPQRFQGPRQP